MRNALPLPTRRVLLTVICLVTTLGGCSESRNPDTHRGPIATLTHERIERCSSEPLKKALYAIQQGGDVDATIPEADGGTVLHLLADDAYAAPELLQALLDLKADPSAQDSSGHTPLHKIAKETRRKEKRGAVKFRLIAPDLMKLLLENGAKPNTPDSSGNTPLHEAAEHGKLKCAQLLLDHKAAVNSKNVSNDTPLHLALARLSKEFDKEMVKLLLNYNADPRAKGKDDETPIGSISKMFKKHKGLDIKEVRNLIELLIYKGAKPTEEQAALELWKSISDLEENDRKDWKAVVKLLGGTEAAPGT